MGGDTTNKLWSAFLQKNVDDLVPARHSAPGGLYAVTVSFFVNKDGSISNVQIVHNPGYGTAEEVQRVMAESPKWQAGIYKGQKVKSLNRQTIYFAVTEE